MYCQKCLMEQADDAVYCQDCGEKLDFSAQLEQQKLQKLQMQTDDIQTKSKKPNRTPIIIGLIFVALIVAVVLFVFKPFASVDVFLENVKDVVNPKTVNEIDASNLQVGDTLRFGTFAEDPIDWTVLAIDDGKALIITKNVITKLPYSNQTHLWDNSLLREWLNSVFIDGFSDQDRQRVIETTIDNPPNPKYGTSAADPTTDYVFCLSIDEASQYFASDSDRVAEFDGINQWWWLRSPGLNDHAGWNAFANVGREGNVNLEGTRLTSNGGVRPVLWINLER